MTSIGNHAATSYLGEDVDFLEAALQNVQDILYEIRMDTEDFETLYKTLYDEDGEHKLGETDIRAAICEEALTQLFSLPWFQ